MTSVQDRRVRRWLVAVIALTMLLPLAGTAAGHSARGIYALGKTTSYVQEDGVGLVKGFVFIGNTTPRPRAVRCAIGFRFWSDAANASVYLVDRVSARIPPGASHAASVKKRWVSVRDESTDLTLIEPSMPTAQHCHERG